MRAAATRAAALFAWALIGYAAAGQDLFGFMPKGGQSLLVELIGTAKPVAGVMPLITETHSEQEWRQSLAGNAERLPTLSTFSDTQLRTLAGYLAINMPITRADRPGHGDAAAWRAVLPPDGKELALKNCQSCHSLYSGYLTQSRDPQGWRSTFDASYHNGILPSERERENFVSYSAINMPVPEASIPAALRY